MKCGPVDMYIKFNKDNISKLLPEQRPGMIFSNPDLFIIFGNNIRFVIWEEILEKLNQFWLEGKDAWDSDLILVAILMIVIDSLMIIKQLNFYNFQP